MSRYTDATVIDLQAAYVVAASEAELERNVQAALDAITLTRVVTAILLGGPGSGGSLSVMIEHGSAGAGFVPDAIEARFYLAEIPAEIANRRAGAAARATAGLSLKDSVLTGTSAGGLTGGMLLFGTASAERNTYLAQTDWYINESTGDDSNSGATSGTALATSAELVRRFGTDPLIDDVTINVWLESDITAVFEMSARFQGDDAAIWIHGGVKTVLATDTIASWTSLFTGAEPAMTAGVLADFSPYKGYRVTMLDGTLAGDSFFLGANPNSGAGANEDWRHGTLSAYTAGVAPSAFTSQPNVPGNGDQFQIEELYTLEGLSLQAERVDLGTAGSAFMATFIVSDLGIYSGTAFTTLIDLNSQVFDANGGAHIMVFNCVLADTPITGKAATFVNCAAGRQDGSLRSATFYGLESMLIDGFTATAYGFYTCGLYRLQDMLGDGGGFTCGRSSETFLDSLLALGLWRTSDASPGVSVDETSTLHVLDVWGASTGTAAGFDIEGALFAPAVADLSSFVVTGNDAEVGGTVRTYAQLPYVEPVNNAMVALNV